MREGGRRLARILAEIAQAAKVGTSTADLDRFAESLIFESGGTPSFKGYRIKGVRMPYPGAICASINEEVVHGIPRKERILKEGDIIGLDIGMWWPSSAAQLRTGKPSLASQDARLQTGKSPESLCTDMAVTVGIGKISKEAQRLIEITKKSLDIGIAHVRDGVTVGDIGFAIESFLKPHHVGIVRDLAGHGVGYELHEEPLIPNYGKPGRGAELKEGMVIAIEPMATLGDWRVVLGDDEWTFKTIDNSLAAHFEHTMAVTKDGVEVLTK